MKPRTERLDRLYPYRPLNPDGTRPCRGCGAVVPRGRKTWCSKACVNKAVVEGGNSSWVAPKVFERDKGICARCGLDTEALKNCLDRWALVGDDCSDYVENRRRQKLVWTRLAELGFNLGQRLWQADHVVPVVEGGGLCGLDGYRTLCTPCHKRETAALRKRLAKPKPAPETPESRQGELF